ncbi:hypothetical protein HPB49_006102 [Dermacentor silvarum]|uniref:Uncharacterized protein n=1 Tax=Dermacentor silvarum TaxID=543639 RepID=A0ACB8DVU5_DERSI|nr:hypothetical protein HPB49_006102 [Dermacentor silvarum]
MANALLNAAANEAHLSSTGASEDEDMEITESPGFPLAAEENEEDNEPWITVTNRGRPKPTGDAQARQPPLPADDYKLAVHPQNGLQLNKVSPGKLDDGITNEAKLQVGSTGFKVRIDEDRNILVLSTASEAAASALSKVQKITSGATTYDIPSYRIFPDNSCKVGTYFIDHDTAPEMALKCLESPGYEALTCRIPVNTPTTVIPFLRKTVPYNIKFPASSAVLPLQEDRAPLTNLQRDRPQRGRLPTASCHTQLRHFANSEAARVPPAVLSLCGGNHRTAAKPFPNGFLPPVNRRKAQQALRRASSSSPRRCGLPPLLNNILGIRDGLYVDDITIWSSTVSIVAMESRLQVVADVVSDYAKSFDLSCALQKSELLY